MSRGPIPPASQCPVETVLDVLGGRWKAVILWWLQDGAQRFSELRRQMPQITQKMLTQQLRELTRDGIIRREIFAQVPPRVEYSLTPLGTSLRDVLEVLGKWAEAHLHEVHQARATAAQV
jgi:DNA-binding HxlR family transcriptional regulator